MLANKLNYGDTNSTIPIGVDIRIENKKVEIIREFMKNILIMGIGRAGKTTLSNMIKDKQNSYNLLHSDSLKWAIIRAKDKEDYYRKNVDIQKEYEHGEFFQRTLLELYKSLIKKDMVTCQKVDNYILEQ